MRRLLLLVALSLLMAAATPRAQTVAPEPRPVNGAEPPARGPIDLFAFDFEQPKFYEMSGHFGPSPAAQPTVGVRYGVRAGLAGQEDIATVIFAMLDERGKPLARLRLALVADSTNAYEFVGFMVVPDHPFRIAATGERKNGQAYATVFSRVFKPVKTAPPAAIPSGLPADVTAALQKILAGVVAEREALVATNPSGTIVLPKMRIFNVKYQPLMSGVGRPVGIRVSYDAQFSETGSYNPRLHVFAEDPTDAIIGRNPLNVWLSTIIPAPRLAHAPTEYADTFRVYMSQLADFVYDAVIVYSFSVELVPNFVSLERGGFSHCLSAALSQRERPERGVRARAIWRRNVDVPRRDWLYRIRRQDRARRRRGCDVSGVRRRSTEAL